MHTRALVLYSGGQDSATCLAWALNRFEHVETIGFDYGQRHRVELECRPTLVSKLRGAFPYWGHKLGDDHLLHLPVLAEISDTSLTQEREITFKSNGLPSTFVPGRNILFFTLAAAVAYRRNLTVLVGGMCETDYSGYPDCRDDTLKSMQVTLGLGLNERIVIETPLMWIDKARTWRMAERLGGTALVELIRSDSHSCYMGDHITAHEWGFGCAKCPACELRAMGWHNYVDSKTATE